MENKDVWTLIVATSPKKNIFREVCKGLQAISHKNNPELYLCKNLILTKWQQTYAFELAAYKRWPQVFKNLSDLGFEYNENLTPLNIPLSTLTQYNDPFVNTYQLTFSCPKYLLAAYFGDLYYLQDYCKDPNNQLTDTFSCKYPAKPVGGYHALHAAIFGGHTAVSIFIMNHSPDLIDKPANDQITSFAIACLMGRTNIVILLLKHNATFITQFDERNHTPLHFACFGPYTDIVQLLLQHSPQLSSTYTTCNASPLHVTNNKEIVQLLLNTPNINVNIVNNLNKTPLDYAYERKNQEMIELLRQHGAQTRAEIEYAQSTDKCSVM